MALTRLVNDYKDSVKASSTGANINLGAAPNTLDGVSLTVNDRVLVKDQTPTSLNGIYRVTTLGTGANGSWTRSSDFNDWREISPGAMVFVEAGSINGNAFYFINGAGSNVTIDTTAINFSNLYSVNGNVTSFPGNVNIAGTLNVTGNIVTQSYETVTLTEYANVQNVAGNINVTNGGNINIGAGGNIYMGSTALPRFRTGNTAPSSPNLGDTWYQGNTDILYEYIQDANNNRYWLDLSSNPSSYGNLTVANTLTLNGTTNNYGTANLGAVSQVIITGGTAGYVLRTDGNGGLSWVAVTASAGGSNTMVQFSDAGSLGGATFIQYNKTSGNLVSNSATSATSTTTGALVLSGGAGIGGSLYVGNIVTTSGIFYPNGATAGGGAGGANTMVQFNDGATIAGSTYLQYNKTSGNLVSNSTTTSTTATTGALVLSGGVGVGGNINAAGYIVANGAFNESTTTPGVYIGNLNATARIGFFNGNASANWQIDNSLGTFRWYTPGVTRMSIDYGGNLTLPGAMLITNTAISTSTTTGALTVSGGVGIGGNLNVSNYATFGSGQGGVSFRPLVGGTALALYNTNIVPSQTNYSWLIDGAAVTINGTSSIYTAINNSIITTSNSATFSVGTTTAATSPLTGALQVSGGAGITGAIYANTHIGSAIYAGTIGNTSASHYGSNFQSTGNVVAQYANAASGISLGSWPTSNQYYGLFNNLGNPANNEYIILSGTADASTYVSSRFGGATYIRGNNNSSAYQLVVNNTSMTVTGGLTPASNNAVALGSASAYWSTIYGVSFVGTSTTAKYADLAEMYHADDYYSPGTVLIFGGDLDVTITKTSHDTRIAGVVSTNPAYLMNDNFESDNWLPVALTGRVPCNVQGPVQKGDLLVSSDKPGIAIKLDKSKYEVGCIIGKSLDIISDTSIRKIEIAVGRY